MCHQDVGGSGQPYPLMRNRVRENDMEDEVYFPTGCVVFFAMCCGSRVSYVLISSVGRHRKIVSQGSHFDSLVLWLHIISIRGVGEQRSRII